VPNKASNILIRTNPPTSIAAAIYISPIMPINVAIYTPPFTTQTAAFVFKNKRVFIDPLYFINFSLGLDILTILDTILVSPLHHLLSTKRIVKNVIKKKEEFNVSSFYLII